MPSLDHLFANVDWRAAPEPEAVIDSLYATHEGVFELGGLQMRCYRLSNGQAIFNADDFEAFFGAFFGEAQ